MRAGPGRAPSPGQSAARAGSRERRAGEGARAPAAVPQPPHPRRPDPGGDKGPETPPTHESAFPRPVPLSCPVSASLCPPVSKSPLPPVRLLVPLPLSSVPQSRSPVPPSVCLPLSLPPCSSSILSLSLTSVPWSLSPFPGSLCPLHHPLYSLSPGFLPSLSVPILGPCLCLAVTLVFLSLFLCPLSAPSPCLSVPFLSLVSLALSVTCLLPPSLSHYLHPCLSAVPPLSTLTASIPGSPIPILPSSLSLSLCAPERNSVRQGSLKSPGGKYLCMCAGK